MSTDTIMATDMSTATDTIMKPGTGTTMNMGTDITTVMRTITMIMTMITVIRTRCPDTDWWRLIRMREQLYARLKRMSQVI